MLGLLVSLFMIMIVGFLLVAFLLPVTRSAGPAARRSACKNNLKQISLALHSYVDEWGALPPSYIVDEDGNPLHSWRTLILPYLEQQELYEAIDLSKAWDDPANATAFKAMVPTYQCPSIDGPLNHTTYLAIVASGSCLRPVEPRQFSEITDGTNDTIMILEVDTEHAVHWMSPLDADEKLVLGLGPESELPHSGIIHASFVDGSVRSLSNELPAAYRKAGISIAGNDDFSN